METSFFSFSLLLLISIILTLCSSTTFSDFTTDQNALLAFKNSITSDTNGVLSKNWSRNTSICKWIGVTCSIQPRRVTALNISSLGIGGTISPHLGNLTFLEYLDMSSNNFTGYIPSELSKLHRLNVINVGFNNLSGEIPSGILTNMSSLIEIDLRFNKLSGQLPSDICSGNTPKIKRIYLRQNNFYGQIPAGIYKCTELEELSLPMNKFDGNIPTEIGNLSMLTSLSLWSNNLQGNIPSSIFNISLLEYLDLSSNNLSGSIPPFNNLPMLGELYLGDNKLTGRIPKQVENLTLLVRLDVSANKLTDMNAHVGDFGISKLFRDGEAAIHTLTMATIGYAAPEYGSEGKVSTSGDVYSYGILLLEMFTGMKPTDDMFSLEMSIKEWVGEALRENAVSEVVAHDLLSRDDQQFSAKAQCVSSILELAMKCLAFSPEERINMMQVVAAIEKIKSCSRKQSRR